LKSRKNNIGFPFYLATEKLNIIGKATVEEYMISGEINLPVHNLDSSKSVYVV
jgi:hypothetical protein